jgi:4-diphosphocytidyl-2-C-methyl-D-erythritol kinase
MHLHKLIPTGAGLGGGSADGAFALKAINELAGNPLDNEQLKNIALELGSDCPFFIQNTPCIGRGRGEILETFELSLNGYYILLINPGIHINTGKAYMQSSPKPWETNLETLLKMDIANWPNNIKNDFEGAVFSQHTEIASIKNWMYKQGATYAAMSGSGSTVYGIFKTIPVIDNRMSNYFSKIVLL